MQYCYCNDPCYYFKKIVSNVNDDGQTYVEHYDINKCIRYLWKICVSKTLYDIILYL